jgi:hypothetical protein
MTSIRTDPKNANRGTPRGRGLLERSLRSYGAGRSVLADKHGALIAGNKTFETAYEIGLPVREVHTSGDELVVVVRDDLDLAEPAARELAIADNRIGQIDLDWDTDVLAELAQEIDLSTWWTDDELASLLSQRPTSAEWDDAFAAAPNGEKSPFEQMTFTLSGDQAEQVRRAMDAAKEVGPFVDTGNENSNGNALARICESYVG